ncbi:MAG: mechanosensitive ion channel domain-containing protein [Gammaproteobacteria bacterium]
MPAVLLIFSSALLADLDPEISRQVGAFDTSLTKMENTLLRSKNISAEALKEMQQSVTKIKSQSQGCVNFNQDNIEKINGDVELLGEVTQREDREVTEKRKSLKKIKLKHEAQLASCRLLILRSNQLIESTQKRQQALIASELLSRNKTLLDHIKDNIDSPGKGLDVLVDFAVSTAGLDVIAQHRNLLALIIAMSLVGTLVLRKLLRKAIPRVYRKSRRSFARRLQLALMSCFMHYMLAFLLTLSFAVYFLYLGLLINNFPFIALVSIGLFLYILLTLVLRVVLDPLRPARPLTRLPREVGLILAWRLRLLAKLLFVGFLVFAASNLHDFSDSVTGILRSIYITLLVLNLCWAFWLLGYIRGLANTHLIRTIIIFALLGGMFADWAGYNNLANFILIGITGSFTALILTFFAATLWTEFFNSFDDGEFAWQQFIRRKIGVQPGEYLPGSMWFRFTFSIVIWSLFIVTILKIWRLSDSSLLAIRDYATEGFNIGPIQIVPSELILALLFFAVFLSLVGWIKRRLQKSWLNRSRMDRSSKESVIALTGYIGVVIAMLIGLTVAGVELANLALIAGALSVGIGFGLQNVVNNFVSGIVLLFERPIKTGDWIIVGETEGYVKKIKLRSTLIQTFDRADVIVPNSEIIAGQVTNWMLEDTTGRIKVPVRAAYGTDPRKVEQILLDIAHDHPMVVSKSATVDQPKVLFREFGESALIFELRCFITDIDNYTAVLSEINFSIAEAFSKAGIEIPFPQTDVHVRLSEVPALTPGK